MGRFEDLEPEELEFKLENAESVEDIHCFLDRKAENYESDYDEMFKELENSITSSKPKLKISPNESLDLELTGRKDITEYLESLYSGDIDKEKYDLFN